MRYRETFLITPTRTESIILGMPFLKRANPDINWKPKTLTPHDVPGPYSLLNPTVIDISNYSPNSGNFPTSDNKKNILLNEPVSFVILPKPSLMN